jgi:hypothetical protein
MQLLNWIICRRVERKEFTPLFCLVLLAILTSAAALAQAVPAPLQSTTGTPAHDVTIAGTVQELVTTHTPGAPVGTQLVAAGPQGAFTASLGSALSDQVRQALSPGSPIQVSGAMVTINGKSYLLARKLTVAGNQVIIRNEHGFLVHTQQHPLARGAK